MDRFSASRERNWQRLRRALPTWKRWPLTEKGPRCAHKKDFKKLVAQMEGKAPKVEAKPDSAGK